MHESIVKVEGKPAYRTLIPTGDKNSPFDIYPFVGLNGKLLESERYKNGRYERVDLTVYPYIGVRKDYSGSADVILGYGRVLDEDQDEGIYPALRRRQYPNNTWQDYPQSLGAHSSNYESGARLFDPIAAYQSFRLSETSFDLAGNAYHPQLLALVENTIKVNDKRIAVEPSLETQFPNSPFEVNPVTTANIPPNLDELVAIMTDKGIPFTLRSLRPYMEAGVYSPSDIVADKLREQKPDKPEVSKKLGTAAALIPLVAAGFVNRELVTEVLNGSFNIDYGSLASLLTTAGLSALATFRAWKARQNHPYLEQFFEATGPTEQPAHQLSEKEEWKRFNEESWMIFGGIVGTYAVAAGTVLGLTYHPEVTIPLLTYPISRLSSSYVYEQKYLPKESHSPE